MRADFLGGVVEGFYGQPWTHRQRLTLFDQMVSWGLNTYFYAPKDDLKHRAAWRELYGETEIDSLRGLVKACQERQLHFIYGLSPGLDIHFADPADQENIRRRLQQMMDVGVRHFALLFDDLPGNMSKEDRKQFASVASAQASVANSAFRWLREKHFDSRLLFCPTPYCDRMVRWDLGGADYLDTVGSELISEIDVLWTGPEIISEDITKDSLRSLVDRIGRQPVIWDNLHANDYDLRRLYCGPYSRSPDLRDCVRGILANPNNEFPINYVPLRTLGEYLHQDDYQPRMAFVNAAKDWACLFQTIDSQVSEDDVMLLSDCYYLPYSDGDNADSLKDTVETLLCQPVGAWGSAYDEFASLHQRICLVFEQLTQLRDRELFYAWSRRIWELREELDLIREFVDAKKNGELTDEGYASETHLTSTCRGGLVASLQRGLPMNDGRFQTP